MIDNPAGFCWGGGVKFLPSLAPLALVSLTLVLSSCANPANRRELYNTSMADSGPWHDYERRREAEATTGVSAGSAPTVVPGTRSRPPAPPASGLPAGTSPAPVGAGAPVPAQATDTSGAPPVPVDPPAATGTGAPAAPDAAAPAPAAPDAAAPAPTPVAP